ncbi:hypothetical protein CYMTET_14185 [Cymbomonas tetramitiformis]|uniref:Uncharacterized protein n=1 Tax=Cymbomonas tetramitiformis TaxID=36881 RepID=A0AAE0LAM3_9CHLO|nr:hypothetical protein CYMTET_14185 [Cymbomonas tetramitiformis]
MLTRPKDVDFSSFLSGREPGLAAGIGACMVWMGSMFEAEHQGLQGTEAGGSTAGVTARSASRAAGEVVMGRGTFYYHVERPDRRLTRQPPGAHNCVGDGAVEAKGGREEQAGAYWARHGPCQGGSGMRLLGRSSSRWMVSDAAVA